MARSSTKAGASANAAPTAPDAPETKSRAVVPAKPKAGRNAATESADELSLSELAAGILARTIRPRVVYVRRLAQAVLEREEKRAKRTAKDGKKKGRDKKRKLAKIPRQKKKS